MTTKDKMGRMVTTAIHPMDTHGVYRSDLMAYWDNGDGTFVVYTFTVRFFDTYDPETCQGCIKKRFTDYTCGWSWARQKESDWASVDKTNFCKIDLESEDVSHDDSLPEEYWDSWNE